MLEPVSNEVEKEYYDYNDGLVVVLSFSRTFLEEEIFERTLYITTDAVSVHEDKQNLEDCINGIKSFEKDAMIFTSNDASDYLESLMLEYDLSPNLLKEMKEYANKLANK